MPPIREAGDDAALLEQRHVLEETPGLVGLPCLRLEHGFRTDQFGDQWTLLGGPLHGSEQGQQPFAIVRVLAQRLAERFVLDLVAATEPRRIGGQEGEGPGGIAFVLGEVETDTADQVPGWVQGGEVALRVAVLGTLRAQRCGDLAPECREQIDGQILAAEEFGGSGDQFGEVCAFRLEGRCQPVALLCSTVARDERTTEAAPERQRWRQVGWQFGSTEVQQAVAVAGAKAAFERICSSLGKGGRSCRVVLQQQAAGRAQGDAQQRRS